MKHTIAFSYNSGIYNKDKMIVTITAPEGFTIAFTTNGNPPSLENDSGLSSLEIEISRGGQGYLMENRNLMVFPGVSRSYLRDNPSLPSGKVLRTALISPSGELEEMGKKVYFLTSDFISLFPGCLAISVVVDPICLLDYETGILATGAVYDAWKQTEEAKEIIARNEVWSFQSNIMQHGRAWERPCFLQIYDGGKEPAAEQNAGIRITGGACRGENQKSFNFYFRDSYGSKFLDYELFEGIGRYRSFQLKSGGNNTEWLKFKDSFLKELVSDRHFTTAESRPAVLFLNGEYWGPYLLTEKLTDQMLHDHYGVKKGKVILVKEGMLKEGQETDILLYKELKSFAEKDLADPVVWKDFCSVMDIRSLADYCAVRIYFGDFDWLDEKNDLLWRTRDCSLNDGRWQYILYDVDYSSGLYNNDETAPQTDHFFLARERYPLFAAALQNREFYKLFLTSLREIGRVNCKYIRVRRLLARYERAWKPLMPDYYKRYGNTRNLWESSRNAMIRFFRKRYHFLLPLVEEYGRQKHLL